MTQTQYRLLPKPCSISPGLWFYLLASPTILAACVLFGLLCAFTSGFLKGWNPTADWLLMWERREAPGHITQVRETKFEENESPVYQLIYHFRLPDGTTHQGLSYSTCQCSAPETIPPGGEPVVVEYHPQHVEVSRIRNGQTSPFGIYWLILLFPGLPLLGFLLAVRGAWRKARLLRQGELAVGRVTSLFLDRNPKDSESSAEFISLAQAAALPPSGATTRCTFEFATPGGTRVQGIGDVPFVQELLAQPEATVLYHPDRPTEAVLLEGIEVFPTGTGEWQPTGKRPSPVFVAFALLGLLGGPYLAWLVSQQPVGLR